MSHIDREARNAYAREWYRRNSAVHIARVKVNRQRTAEEYRRRLDEIKSAPCTDCGGSFPPYVMDFDHLDAIEKIDNVGTLVSHVKTSWEKIAAEIAKCELVCANCHRIRTHTRRLSQTA